MDLQRSVSGTATMGARHNHPFLEVVQRSVDKGAPHELAYRITWWTYYTNRKDALLGDNPGPSGLTAAQTREKDAQMAEKAAELGIPLRELYSREAAAAGLLGLGTGTGGRSKRRTTKKKTLKRRQSRKRA